MVETQFYDPDFIAYFRVDAETEFRMSVKLIKVIEIFQASIQPIYGLYHKVFFKELENPYDISGQTRSDADEPYGYESTYGEIVFESFASIFERMEPQPGQVFWDLGAGNGKPMALAALLYPQIVVRGVEYMDGLAKEAERGFKLM